MNKITCDMCMDLMPLVRDGIASEDSRRAVEEHINYCDCCKKRYGEKITDFSVDVDLAQELAKLKRRLQIFSAMLMMLGVFFGLSLTASEDMFYNSLIMPVIGVLGYVIFRWKAVYQVPILLLVIQFLINFLARSVVWNICRWKLLCGLEFTRFLWSLVCW